MQIAIQYGSYVKMVGTEDGPVEHVVETFHIEASDAAGHRWVLDGSDTEDEKVVAATMLALTHDPITNPDAWVVSDPLYGSDAWGDEDEYNLACFEADCYNEPRPRW